MDNLSHCKGQNLTGFGTVLAWGACVEGSNRLGDTIFQFGFAYHSHCYLTGISKSVVFNVLCFEKKVHLNDSLKTKKRVIIHTYI